MLGKIVKARDVVSRVVSEFFTLIAWLVSQQEYELLECTAALVSDFRHLKAVFAGRSLGTEPE